MTSTGYRRKKKKKSETVRRADNLFNLWLSSRSNYKKAYFWIISVSEASKWSQITFCILTNIPYSISERSGPNFEQIDISPTATVCKFVVSSDSIVIYTHWLTDSLTKTDSIVAHGSLGSKLQIFICVEQISVITAGNAMNILRDCFWPERFTF